MIVGLIGSNRLYKIGKPLRTVGLNCEYIKINNIKNILNFRGDVVFVDIAGFQILLGWLIKKINKGKCVIIYRARGDYTEELYPIKRALVTAIIKACCDRVVTVSYNLKKNFIRKNIFTKEGISCIPIPKSVDKFSKDVRDYNNKFILITITNFDYFGKIKPLFDVAKTVNDWLERIDGLWLILGAGKYLNNFIKFLKKNRLYRLKCVGFVNDVHRYLQMADVMIHLSRLEGLPNSVLEGMLAGLPVIVNDYEPLREIDPVIVIKDERELIRLLEELYDNPKSRRKFGHISHKYVKNNFNYNKIGLKFKKFLESIIPR